MLRVARIAGQADRNSALVDRAQSARMILIRYASCEERLENELGY